MTSAIHDIGYQRYDGERLGTGSAWRALFVQGLRTTFGLGRPARAKVLPVLMLVLSTLPAVFAVAISASISNRAPVPIGHGNYFPGAALLYLLFVAAQAPELFSRDQANRVLPLILSRDLSRWQYGSARLSAVVVAMLLLGLVPHLLLWVGGIGTADDAVVALQEGLPLLGAIVIATTLVALLLGSVSSAIAAFMPRRFLATAAIAGLFIVLGAINSALDSTDLLSPAAAELINPLSVLANMNRLLFPETLLPTGGPMASGLTVYVLAVLAYSSSAIALVWWRTQRVDA